MRRLIAGTGWKLNNTVAETRRYAEAMAAWTAGRDLSAVDIFVLPPFTSLHAAATAFAGSPVKTGGQNMHWEDSGGWTGEISAPMLVEAGCHYVELAHSERLQYFGENYAAVRLKVDKAMAAGLTPIVCLGESSAEKEAGRADEVLAQQMLTALSGQPEQKIPEIVLAYEPRWAIGGAEAASPDYIAERLIERERAVESDALVSKLRTVALDRRENGETAYERTGDRGSTLIWALIVFLAGFAVGALGLVAYAWFMVPG